jgi:transcriptional regulator with XRE-family HTH domain
MTVGERVKIIAEKQGISLKELAKQANLSYNTVYSITRRGSERVAPDTISRLANALGVNVNELTADASIRVNSAPEMVELQQKVAAGQATEQEKQAWLEANLQGLKRMQHSIEFMLSELEQYDGTKEIARQSRLMSMFNQLTDDGQEKALDFLEILLGNPDYKK